MTKKNTPIIVKTRRTKAPAGDDTARIVLALQAMAVTEGWAIVVQTCERNIEYLEQSILSKCEPTTEEILSDADVDLLRAKRDFLLELKELPQRFMEKLSESPEPPQNFDPYYKTADDIIRARRGTP